ncbi:MAG: hypothetical protein ABIO72_06120 [Patescibacteria group bacterium]
MKKQILKSDKFKKARGGYSRLLEIGCTKCGHAICLYQKDGPGILKRMYVDRMLRSDKLQNLTLKELPQLACSSCKEHVGVPFIYKKENRLAYRLFVGSVAKKIVDSSKVKL